MSKTKVEVHEALDTLFNENNADVNKNQDYKSNFQEFELPNKYYLIEMYNKQRELQQFLADRGKTKPFPFVRSNARQDDIQLAIYHLFCMQIEYQELKIELNKISQYEEENPGNGVPDEITISARYELIDMFFFMFNVGIYSGLDINEVVNYIENNDEQAIVDKNSTALIDKAINSLLNYIDKLPWKAWKEYDYSRFYAMSMLDKQMIIKAYADALKFIVNWAKAVFAETDKSLFDLYMNKWIENKRRQEDINSGYILSTPQGPDIPTGFPGDIAEAIDNK